LAALSGAKPAAGSMRLDGQVLARSSLFVITFSAIFILLGLGTTAVGSFLFRNQLLLSRIAGATIIAMGVLLITGELIRLNIEAQNLLEGLHLNFFQSV